jgi:putative heme-binding domain-containing protein
VKAAASDAGAALKIEKAAPRLYALLENRDQPEDVRLAALKALGGLGSERIGDAIGLALDDENEALRKEARRILAGLKGSGEAAVAALRAALNKGTLREKQSALETLGGMGNEAANEVLAERMRKLLEGALSPALRLDVLEAAREAAENSEKLADLVQEYESSLPEDDPLAEWRVALRGGDPKAGKEIVFEHVSAQCLRCHQIEGEGGEVAPDLTTIAERRDRPYMLGSLIRPAAEIAEGYAMVTLTLDNGETVAGTLGEETNSHVTVQLLSGEKQKVRKSEIASRQSTQASAMPPMGSILDKQQVRDLIAYLSTLK